MALRGVEALSLEPTEYAARSDEKCGGLQEKRNQKFPGQKMRNVSFVPIFESYPIRPEGLRLDSDNG